MRKKDLELEIITKGHRLVNLTKQREVIEKYLSTPEYRYYLPIYRSVLDKIISDEVDGMVETLDEVYLG